MVNIDVPDDIILSRISDRWLHLPSGRVYNMSYNPPKVEGYDDITGEPLTKRPDDNPVSKISSQIHSFYVSMSDGNVDQTGGFRSPPDPVLHINVSSLGLL